MPKPTFFELGIYSKVIGIYEHREQEHENIRNRQARKKRKQQKPFPLVISQYLRLYISQSISLINQVKPYRDEPHL